MPDLAMVVALLCLAYGLLLGQGVERLFRDSDTGWHIRIGERLLAGHPLPRTDPYSFTRPGAPWIAWEWGSDLVMGAAHRWGGLQGVALLYTVVVAAAGWLWMRLHWSVGGNFFLAVAMASPLLTTIQLHWLARPHVFGWLLSLAALLLLEKAPQRFRFRHGVAAAAGGALWANVHASFMFLPLMALIYAAGNWMKRRLWDEPGKDPGWYVRVAVWALSGTVLNPYGWALHEHVVRYLSNRELLSRIGEFQSFQFQAQGSLQVLLTVGLAAFGASAAFIYRRPEHALLSALLLALALRSARGLPLLAWLALPLANGAITQALVGGPWRRAVGERLQRFLAYSGRLRRIDSLCGGYAWAPVAVMAAVALLQTPAVAAKAAFPASEFPVQAAEQVAALPESARLLAPDKYGGYLIYRFEGRRKVFFDGRSDFYGLELMKDYIRLMEARPGWREQVDRLQFTHALLPNDYSLVAGLEQWGWKRLYRDSTATLLQRN